MLGGLNFCSCIGLSCLVTSWFIFLSLLPPVLVLLVRSFINKGEHELENHGHEQAAGVTSLIN